MFNISDVMIDKEEVSMTFQIPTIIPDGTPVPEDNSIKDEQIYVSDNAACVSESHIRQMVKKVAGILAAQGVSCCECPKTHYKLYSLSDCKESIIRYSLEIACPNGDASYRFELTLSPVDMDKGSMDPESNIKKIIEPKGKEENYHD